MLNQVKTGDINAVEKTVKRLVGELRSKIGLSSDNVRQIFNQLVGDTIIKYLTDSNIDMSHIFGSNFNIYNELSKKETVEDIEQWLIKIYKIMFGYLNKYKSDDDKIYKIMDYIQMNYKRDIGIQDIADYVGLSYSHVRKIFKDKIGKNIGDVINSLRMQEAKDLLVRTEISIKDLALVLGYNNDQTFSRIFKKLEGITPGEYRTKTVLIDKNRVYLTEHN
jgi:AraC-like DNA-binding protein